MPCTSRTYVREVTTQMEGEIMSKHRVLIVDDQAGVVDFLSEFFEHKGYDVFSASSGKDALKVVNEKKPHIILLDLQLGWGKGGMDVLKEIKESRPKTKVIMMTGVSDESVVEEARQLGADDYIVKPFSLAYLEEVVMFKLLNMEIQRLGDIGEE